MVLCHRLKYSADYAATDKTPPLPIFLPLTLIAGFFGQNFEHLPFPPGLSRPGTCRAESSPGLSALVISSMDFYKTSSRLNSASIDRGLVRPKKQLSVPGFDRCEFGLYDALGRFVR